MAHRIAVATSGGRDSTALLHATAHAARKLGSGIEVHALHVHHGLMPQADEWLVQLRRQCQRWARAGLPVVFHSMRLPTRPARGESVEAWARRERYAALAAMAQAAQLGVVLLAHHRRDQAETLLLQALRGTGPAGMAAMPADAKRAGLRWLRPWLGQPHEAIEAYVQRHRLRFVVDPSNHDPRFERSRLRAQVWPAIEAAFPDAQATLSLSARRMHEASVCAQALAGIDATACVDGDGALQVAAWRGLGQERQANLLRPWLREQCRSLVPESLVQRLLDELPRGRSGAAWPLAGGALRLYRGRLRFVLGAEVDMGRPGTLTLDLSRAGVVEVPQWGGAFVVQRASGIPAAMLKDARLQPRCGGEQFQRAPQAVARSLKKQFQAAGVPEWQRQGPLVYAGSMLVFVPGLGLDARISPAPGVNGRTLHWRPDAQATWRG